MSSERNRSLPDDLRALGLMVAVHNDYRLNDVPHTFWLMTLPNEDGTALAFKGEGVNDAEALDQIRAQVKGFFNLEGPSPAPPDIGVSDALRFMRDNPPPLPMFPCTCGGAPKTTSAPCPFCMRIVHPTTATPPRIEDVLYPDMRSKAVGIAREMVEADARRTPLEQELAHVPHFKRSTEAGPPPTHLAPMVKLSDKPPSSAAKVSSQPGDRVRVDIDGQIYDFGFVQACDLCENIAAALPEIRWGEGSGLHPGEVVLEQSHPGSRRAAVRPVDDGIALRAVECDGQPAGGSIFLHGEAVDALIVALNAARGVRVHDGPALPASGMQALSTHLQDQADQAAHLLLSDLITAGATRFAPAHLTARRCSPTHLQLLDEGVVTADWWPSTGKARAAGPTTGVAAPFKIFTVDALVEWLKGL